MATESLLFPIVCSSFGRDSRIDIPIRGYSIIRTEVDRHSWDFDWSRLGRAYHTAHDLAQARLGAEITPVAGGVPMVSASTLSRRQVIGWDAPVEESVGD